MIDFKKITKIITHPGRFHEDDVRAVAYAANNGARCAVERREPTSKELANTSILVLDVGHIHKPKFLCFDHHQYRGGKSAFELLVDANGEADKKINKLAREVSAFDTGIKRRKYTECNLGWFNNLPDLTQDQRFDIAVLYARTENNNTSIFSINAYSAAKKATLAIISQGENTVKNGDLIAAGGFAAAVLSEGDMYPQGWQEYAPGHVNFLISFEESRAQWVLASRDNNVVEVPADETQIFRHINGFMASYKTKDAAIRSFLKI